MGLCSNCGYIVLQGQRTSRLQASLNGFVFMAPECVSGPSKEGDMYCLGLLIVYLYQQQKATQPDKAGQQPFGPMDPIIQGKNHTLIHMCCIMYVTLRY